MFLIKNLKLIKNINLFQKVEDVIRRNLLEQHSTNQHLKKKSDINQIRTKKQNILQRKFITGDTKKWLLSFQQDQMSYMRVTNTQTRESSVFSSS